MIDNLLLTSQQMRAAENAAFSAGASSTAFMDAAGQAVASVLQKGWTPRKLTILCGPGNNGGDGFVVARVMKKAGWTVRVGLFGQRDKLSGDAALMAEQYDGLVEAASPNVIEDADLIVDALFGIGLSRPIDGALADLIEKVNAHRAPVVAIDVPSGINADTGEVMGVGVAASHTVTFLCKKPGHILFPGRAFCGLVSLVDIGIELSPFEEGQEISFENHPRIWAPAFVRPGPMTHKFERGHVFVVSGGPLNTGAARLSASAAQRAGAGLVTLASPGTALGVNGTHLTSIMLAHIEDGEALSALLSARENYRNVCVIGPGAGLHEGTKEKVRAVLSSPAQAILDADALSVFVDRPEELRLLTRRDDVLTPHGGEFARVFPEVTATNRLSAAREAAKLSGSIVVFKGADTVIAAPDGKAVINANAPPDLATAGAGDVLAGFIGGLSAQGMDAFAAACAGVWLHGACAHAIGPGLIADDLPQALPTVLRGLLGGGPKKSEGDG